MTPTAMRRGTFTAATRSSGWGELQGAARQPAEGNRTQRSGTLSGTFERS